MGAGRSRQLTSIEICAGAGGQALGLHRAGFRHKALVEWDDDAVETLKANVRKWPGWKTKADKLTSADVKEFADDPCDQFKVKKGEIDLLAGGVPCPPFSLAGRQLGKDDERDLFPDMLEIVGKLEPRAVMIENVRGLLEPWHTFSSYRKMVLKELGRLGYVVADGGADLSQSWRILEARDFGVPQLRPRAILVAIRADILGNNKFIWPIGKEGDPVNVADALRATMLERCEAHGAKGIEVFKRWLKKAEKEAHAGRGVAPTLVGGSRKHGGADLGPTRAKRAWAALGINAMGVANDHDPELKYCAPERDIFRETGPMLTVKQAAIIQGFPPGWEFKGRKTARYRQVGNAFPPPVAEAVGRAIAAVLQPARRDDYLQGLVMEEETEHQEIAGLFPEFELSGSRRVGAIPSSNDRCGDLIDAVG